MPNEIGPLLALLIGAALIFAGGRLSRRIGLPETTGCGVALCIVAVVLGLATAWRAQWAGGDGGDRLLTYARLVGLTGMLFLAGTTFRVQDIRRKHIAGFVALSALLFIITTLLFSSLAGQPVGTAAFIAASFVSSSLWFPAAFRTSQIRNYQNVAVDLSGSIALTATAMFGAYLAEALSAIPATRSTATAFAIVTLYELVKLAVVFGFAYFIATRFLARAHGRVSRVRTNVGFILISILFFALISLAAGTIGSMAWAFVAGALWRKTELGDEFGKRAKPIASALLLSLVFLSLLLQVHGRESSFSRGVIVAAAVAIALKLLSAWLVLRRYSNENRETLFVSAAMAFPGEMAILFLSVAVTRFAIDGPIFFIVLSYAFLSALLIPVCCLLHDRLAQLVPAKTMGVRNMNSRFIQFSLTAILSLLIINSASGQEFKYTVEKDRMIGHRDGELIISDAGVEYRATKREKENRTWSYGDIRLFEILSPTKVRIWTYKDRKLRFGGDERLTFKIIDGQIDPSVSAFVRERIAGPVVTSVFESEATEIAQIPVKHSHRFGGCEGILRLFPETLVFESRTGHDSRSWRWTDIRSVGRSDVYRFDVETFEPQVGASSRSFNFVLKEQLPDRIYDLIWNRVYRPAPLIRTGERTDGQ